MRRLSVTAERERITRHYESVYAASAHSPKPHGRNAQMNTRKNQLPYLTVQRLDHKYKELAVSASIKVSCRDGNTTILRRIEDPDPRFVVLTSSRRVGKHNLVIHRKEELLDANILMQIPVVVRRLLNDNNLIPETSNKILEDNKWVESFLIEYESYKETLQKLEVPPRGRVYKKAFSLSRDYANNRFPGNVKSLKEAQALIKANFMG